MQAIALIYGCDPRERLKSQALQRVSTIRTFDELTSRCTRYAVPVQEESTRSAAQAKDEEDLENGDSGWSEVRKTRYINYVTVSLTHAIIFLVLGTRGYTIVRDTINDG